MCGRMEAFRFNLAIDHTHLLLVHSMCSRVHADLSPVVSKTTTYHSKRKKMAHYFCCILNLSIIRRLFMRMQRRAFRWVWKGDVCLLYKREILRSSAFIHVLVVCYSSCCSASPVWGRQRGTTAAWLCSWRTTGKSFTRCLTQKESDALASLWAMTTFKMESWFSVEPPLSPDAEACSSLCWV